MNKPDIETVIGVEINKIWSEYFRKNPKMRGIKKIKSLSTIPVERKVYELHNHDHPKEVLDEISKLKFYEADAGIAENLNASPKTLDRLFNNLPQTNISTSDRFQRLTVLISLSYHPNCSLELFNKLQQLNIPDVDNGLIDNHKLPTEIYEKYYTSTNFHIKVRLVLNDRTPSHVLEHIFLNTKNERGVENIFVYLAENEKTPTHILEKLAETNKFDTEIFEKLFSNPSTPEHVWLKGISDATHVGLSNLAANPALTEKLFDILKNHEDGVVRFYIARNKNTPTHVLEQFTQDKNGAVRTFSVNRLFRKNFFGDWPQEWVEAHYDVKLRKEVRNDS